jgi:hypothetical protein
MTVALANDYIGDRFVNNAITKDDSTTLSYAPTNVINTRVDAAPTFTTPFYVPYLFSIVGLTVDQVNISTGGYSPTFGYSVNFPDACNVYRAAGSDFQYASMIGVPAMSYVTPIGVESRFDNDWQRRELLVDVDATGDPNLFGRYIPFSGSSVIIGDSDASAFESGPIGISLGEDGLRSLTTSYTSLGCTLDIGIMTNFNKQLTSWSASTFSSVSTLRYYTHDDSEIQIGAPTPFILGSYHEDVVNLTLDATSSFALSSDDPFEIIGFDYTYASAMVPGTVGRIALETSSTILPIVLDVIAHHRFIPHDPISSAILALQLPQHTAPFVNVTKIHYICIGDMDVSPIPPP